MEELVFKTKVLRCIDCGLSFLWEPGEQKFYLSKGLQQPKRCGDCRKFRRITISPKDGGDNHE